MTVRGRRVDQAMSVFTARDDITRPGANHRNCTQLV
jgi:hypothetical protein